ncbi:MAG TPA: hypothetical protein VK522_08405 [Pseudolabrys sp.]|nr:hypothetical protein [Pseudolabrys sp.]
MAGEGSGKNLNLEVDDSLSVCLVLGREDIEYVIVDCARRSFRGLVGHELNSGLRHLNGYGIDGHETLCPKGLRRKFTFCKEIGLMTGCLLSRPGTEQWHVRERRLSWPFPVVSFRQGKQALLGEGISPVGKRPDAGGLLFEILVVHNALEKRHPTA